MQDPPVRAVDVSIRYGRDGTSTEALNGMSLDVGPGEFVSIIGPSGCGKSTFLKALADLLPDARVSGEMQVNGQSPRAARLGHDFAFVFQTPALLPWRTVLANVRLPAQVVPSSNARSGMAAEELLERVGLTGSEHLLPHECSGGMQQRVAIARGLALNPVLMMMDEPFGALDEITRDRIHLELMRVLGENGPAVIFVTHSISEAVFLSDRIVVMTGRPGRVRAVIDVDLPRPRGVALRRTLEFFDYESRVLEALAG
jgi:NitT/TauT family transport system ATP-binding protein